MRRAVALAVLWLAVAAVAVAAAWQGVAVVADQVTDDRPAALSPAEIDRRLARTPGTTGAPPTVQATAPPPSAPPGETRTYNLTGGTVALRFTADEVTVVFANPAPGFAVEVERRDGDGVRVELESDDHDSRVEGWWEDGPAERVVEDGDDDRDDEGGDGDGDPDD